MAAHQNDGVRQMNHVLGRDLNFSPGEIVLCRGFPAQLLEARANRRWLVRWFNIDGTTIIHAKNMVAYHPELVLNVSPKVQSYVFHQGAIQAANDAIRELHGGPTFDPRNVALRETAYNAEEANIAGGEIDMGPLNGVGAADGAQDVEDGHQEDEEEGHQKAQEEQDEGDEEVEEERILLEAHEANVDVLVANDAGRRVQERRRRRQFHDEDEAPPAIRARVGNNEARGSRGLFGSLWTYFTGR